MHVIFLKPDGSGYIDKRTWGSPFGPALVYLSPPDDFTTELHIGEGIETMLGAYHKHGAYPITAALGSLAYVPHHPARMRHFSSGPTTTIPDATPRGD